MVLLNRVLLAVALGIGFAGAAPAATVSSIKVFDGEDVPFLLLPALDPGRVDAFVLPIGVSGPAGGTFELSAGATFDLDPLGGALTGFFLNIFDADLNLVVEGGDPISAAMVTAGPMAELSFTVVDGSILGRFGSTGLLRLSGLTGPDAFGNGTVDVEIFLAPIPLPAAASLMLTGLAGLALFRARRRACRKATAPTTANVSTGILQA